MKYQTSFCALLLFLGVSTHAQTDQVCTDLFKFSCAPGVYDDGTGKASIPESLNDKADEVYKNLKVRNVERFKKALVDPKNGALRRGILSASGLNAREDCTGADDNPEGECLEMMAEYGANMIHYGDIKLRGQSKPIFAPGDIDDRAYLLNLEAFKAINKESTADLRREFNADELDEKMRSMTKSIKSILIAKIKEKVVDPAAQKIMIDRIKDANPMGSNCTESGTAAMPEVMVANMFYNPLSRNVTYCFGNRIRNTSDFSMAFFIAHELSHAVDPCNIQLGPKDFSFQYKSQTYPEAEREYPLPGLIVCLRQDTSVGAQRVPKVRGMMGAPSYPYGDGSYPQAQASPAPPAPEVFKSFCGADQIPECGADWWAAEVLPEYIAKHHSHLSVKQIRTGYSNVARSYCDESETKEKRPTWNTHPTFKKRMDFLLLVQPEVRRQMGCPVQLPPKRKYCTGKDEESYPLNQMRPSSEIPTMPKPTYLPMPTTEPTGTTQ